MKKSLAFGVLAITSGLVVGSGLILQQKASGLGIFSAARAGDGSYTLTIDANNIPSGLTTSYQNNVEGTVKTTENHDVKLNFVNAKLNAGTGTIQVANHGKIYNSTSGDNKAITGITSVSFAGTGSFVFKPAIAPGMLADVDPVSVAAGSLVTVPSCHYFEIEAGDSGFEASEIKFNYTCNGTTLDPKLLNGKYTGVGDDGYTYRLEVNNLAVSLSSLDKETNTHLDGTATIISLSPMRASCAFTGFTYVMDYDGHSFTFVSKSGAYAAGVPQINFNRVYNVEDFQSYTASGQGYTNSTTKYQTTNLRSAFYADYYTGSSSSEIGGSGWQIMTSTDNTNYNSQKGHNSSKVGIFKFSNGSSMRYISMNELYGVKNAIGKGAKLSFWARGAYTNTNFNTNHASNTAMKFYAYYDSPLTPSTQTSVRESFDFTVQAGATWQHFEMPLTAGRTYYGFGFWSQQGSGSTQYVPIDDIEIYTASPYAEYVAPVAVSGVSVTPTAVEIEKGKTSTLTATVIPENATNQNVSWSSNNTSVATVNSTGKVTAVAAGNATITVTTVDGGYTANCAVTVTEPATGAYPEGSFKGTAVVNSANFSIVIALGNEDNHLVAVSLANKDAVATGVTYNKSSKQITITTTGSYQGMATYGTITGTYDEANDQITNIACGGSISSYVSNNGSITATRFDSGNFWDCDGTTSELRQVFKRRYGDPWQVDTGNTDRINSNTTQFVSGTGSVKVRAWTGGRYALNFLNDFSLAKKVQNVQFWVYNSSATDVTLRMWYYQATNFGSNGETGSVTAKANGWTYCAMGFGSGSGDGNRTIYNFQIADFTKTGAYLSFDNIVLF